MRNAWTYTLIECIIRELTLKLTQQFISTRTQYSQLERHCLVMERAVSPTSDSDEFDSLELEEVGEKSLWILRGEGKEQSLRSLRASRSLRTKELEALRRENEDLKKQAGGREEREAELRQREKQIASLTQQLEVCQPRHHIEISLYFWVVFLIFGLKS